MTKAPQQNAARLALVISSAFYADEIPGRGWYRYSSTFMQSVGSSAHDVAEALDCARCVSMGAAVLMRDAIGGRAGSKRDDRPRVDGSRTLGPVRANHRPAGRTRTCPGSVTASRIEARFVHLVRGRTAPLRSAS